MKNSIAPIANILLSVLFVVFGPTIISSFYLKNTSIDDERLFLLVIVYVLIVIATNLIIDKIIELKREKSYEE